MENSLPSCAPGLYLVTLGTPALLERGTPIPLRKKDLALLVHLRLEGRHGHSRGALAGLLWGNSPEENARHSLTQALGRLRARLGGALEVGHGRVGCRATLPCDAAALLQAAALVQVDESVLSLCAGDFLAGFSPGPGAEAFEAWADGRRAHLRTVAVAALDRLGAAWEDAGAWERALAAGQRAVELDPASEPAHRRVMRAWNALGHRVRALQHHDRLAAWLAAEFETGPEPETAQLARQLRSRATPPPRAAAEPASRPPRPVRHVEPVPHRGPPRSFRPPVHCAWGAFAGLAVLLALLWNSGMLMGLDWTRGAEPEETPPALYPPLAAPTDGRWIYYRYGRWMPGACDHPTRAVGNRARDGWTAGITVHCIDDAWLALDVERLGERFSIAPHTTYCVNVVYATGNSSHWGRHGVEDAPNLEAMRVVSPNGAYNIGFAIVRERPGRRRVHLTNAYPAPRC